MSKIFIILFFLVMSLPVKAAIISFSGSFLDGSLFVPRDINKYEVRGASYSRLAPYERHVFLATNNEDTKKQHLLDSASFEINFLSMSRSHNFTIDGDISYAWSTVSYAWLTVWNKPVPGDSCSLCINFPPRNRRHALEVIHEVIHNDPNKFDFPSHDKWHINPFNPHSGDSPSPVPLPPAIILFLSGGLLLLSYKKLSN